MAQESSICRRCFSTQLAENGVCAACAGKDILRHAELFDLSIAHLDCDAFYAAIEKRDDPSLADKPLIVGGGVRGVVSTCCYIARTYGVRSAMPMFKARQACPGAVIIKPNMDKYAKAGRAIRQMMLDLTPIVEPLSIDEAFMDLSGTTRLHGGPPALTLLTLQRRVENEMGVTASIGLSHNKFLAKIASDFDKPNGFSVVGKAETLSFLASLPVRSIWGVGNAMAQKLEQDGITSVSHLQVIEESVLAKRYGEMGLRLARLSQGKDFRPVKPQRDTKSISSETTFNADIRDVRVLEDYLWELSEKVSARMKVANFEGRIVTVKLKTAGFQSVTRRQTLPDPTNLARLIFDTGKRLLYETAHGEAYRLIGIGLSGLTEPSASSAQSLFDDEKNKIAAQEKAIDELRHKFGKHAVSAARTLNRRQQ